MSHLHISVFQVLPLKKVRISRVWVLVSGREGMDRVCGLQVFKPDRNAVRNKVAFASPLQSTTCKTSQLNKSIPVSNSVSQWRIPHIYTSIGGCTGTYAGAEPKEQWSPCLQSQPHVCDSWAHSLRNPSSRGSGTHDWCPACGSTCGHRCLGSSSRGA